MSEAHKISKRGLIIVVDDESGIRNGIGALLEDASFTVKCASNGREALLLLKEQRPRLIITDLMMPELSGKDLARTLLLDEQLAAVPRLLITGAYIAEDDEARDLFIQIVEKPISTLCLLEAVENALTTQDS